MSAAAAIWLAHESGVMIDSERLELIVASQAASLPVVRNAVEQMARMEQFTDAETHGLLLAIDEALANVIKHGYEGRPDQPIRIVLAHTEGPDGRKGLAVEVRDQGRQVDPATIRGRDLDDVRPGGLGVHIMQSVMDEVCYSCPPDGGMLLRMVKYAGSSRKDGHRPPDAS